MAIGPGGRFGIFFDDHPTQRTNPPRASSWGGRKGGARGNAVATVFVSAHTGCDNGGCGLPLHDPRRPVGAERSALAPERRLPAIDELGKGGARSRRAALS